MSNRWYYQMLLEEFGPVTTQQLEQLIEEGTLSDDDLVRPENSTNWFKAASLDAHRAAGDAGPAEIADLSELSFSFEPSGTNREQTVASGSKPPVSDTMRMPDRQAPSFFELPEVETDVYFCQSLGQTLGPLPLAEIVSMAESGSLSDCDLVRIGESGAWQPAMEISELSATFMLMDHVTPAAIGGVKTSSNTDTVAESRTSPMLENIPAAPPLQPAASIPSEPPASSESASPALRKKVRRKKTRKEEDEVLDEIFDDVFVKQEDEKPSRTSPPAQPSAFTSPPVTSAPLERPETNKPVAPVAASVSSASSSLNSSTAAAASAAMSRAAVTHSRSRVGFSFDGPVRTVTIGILLISVVGGLIWQFGLASLSFGGPNISRIAGRMTVAVVNFKAMGEKPSQGQWQDFCQATRAEFLPQYKSLVESGASGKTNTACMEGIKAIIALTSTKPEDLDRRKELVANIEKHIAETQ